MPIFFRDEFETVMLEMEFGSDIDRKRAKIIREKIKSLEKSKDLAEGTWRPDCYNSLTCDRCKYNCKVCPEND